MEKATQEELSKILNKCGEKMLKVKNIEINMKKEEMLKEFKKAFDMYDLDDFKKEFGEIIKDPLIAKMFNPIIKEMREKGSIHNYKLCNGNVHKKTPTKLNIKLDMDIIETEIYRMIRNEILNNLKSTYDKTVQGFDDRIVIYDKDKKPLKILMYKDLEDDLKKECYAAMFNYINSSYKAKIGGLLD